MHGILNLILVIPDLSMLTFVICLVYEILFFKQIGSQQTAWKLHVGIIKSHFMIFVCLFELMLYVPVNSSGHVGTLPPLYGTFTQNEGVMPSNKCLK